MYERGNINTRAYWNMRYASGNYPSAIDEFFRRIRAVYNLCEGQVLDVGCGEGLLVNMLASTGSKAVGLDHSKVGLEHGQKGIANLADWVFNPVGDFVLGGAHSLPFGDGSFDTVVATELLEHVDDLLGVVGELKRVCRIGGRVVVSSPREGQPAYFEHVREIGSADYWRLFDGFKEQGWSVVGGVMIFWGRKVS